MTTSPFLKGQLHDMTRDAVMELHARYRTRITAVVDEAVQHASAYYQERQMTLPANVRAALVEYAHACARTRRKITVDDLTTKARLGAVNIEFDAQTMLATQLSLEHDVITKQKAYERTTRTQASPRQRRLPVAREKMTIGQRLDALVARIAAAILPPPGGAFGEVAGKPPLPDACAALPWDGHGRIYFALSDDSASPVKNEVVAYLAQQGYTVTDYAANRAVDNRKNERKIGKLLKDHPALLKAFQEDSTRTEKDLMVVLTRNTLDIARGSVDRGWQSCRANARQAVHYAVNEAAVGVMAAYLVSTDDPEINNPLARINIKPYDRITREQGSVFRVNPHDSIYAPFNPIGLHHTGFVDAIYSFIDTLNTGKTGRFLLRRQCENFQEYRVRTLLPHNGEAALKALRIKYKKTADGRLVVKKGISLDNLGLLRLPDLTNVTVNGSVNLSGNRLMTLEGMPQHGVQNLVARNNLLVCFAGAAQNVARDFDYRDNAWLVSTLGAPKAQSYLHGNRKGHTDNMAYNHSHTMTCIGPLDEPARFPGFKR